MNTSARLLITEDELVVALDLERRLRKLGYDVCARATTGEEAISAVDKLKPNLVLMDICLPGQMDGVEAAAIIADKHAIPIVYLTANADETTLQRARATNPASYLLKPFRERELQICVEMALQNHALRQQLRTINESLEQLVHLRTAELLTANHNLRNEVAARTKAEQLAREQATLLDIARDAIFVRTIEGHITYWNRSAAALYGLPREAAVGQRAEELLCELPLDPAADPASGTLNKGEWLGEMTTRSHDGSERVVESRWTLVRDMAGAPQAFLVVNTDISEKKRQEEQQARASRMDSVGALASGIAHDLNNVFTPMIMASQLLEDESSPAVQNSARLIRSSAERGSALVRQILQFVKGGHGEFGAFRPEHLAREVLRLLRESFPPKIEFSLRYSEGVWSVFGDSSRIHQILTNLCVNARDAMEHGGRLTIRLENFVADEIYSRLNGTLTAGKYVAISVEDTGTGMAPEIKAKIFDPFFTTKSAKGGTGLGLANVRTIVQEHNGHIEVNSTPGKGTIFRVLLPGCEEPPTVIASTPLVPMPCGNGEHVLLVDDEHGVREIVSTTLKAHGYEVEAAIDGLDGLTLLASRTRDVDVLVTDLAMPNLDGLALARAARRLNPDLPILIASGTLPAGISQEALEREGYVLLSKPFSAVQLLEALAGRLAVKDQARRPKELAVDLAKPISAI